MYVDAKDNRHLSKKVINKSSTELWGQDHEKTTYTCKDCLHAWGPFYDMFEKKMKELEDKKLGD